VLASRIQSISRNGTAVSVRSCVKLGRDRERDREREKEKRLL
jgi:hypothetical protein